MTTTSIVGGKWEILADIGQGSMGTVHRARNVESHKLVALKLLNSRTADPDRFKVEAQVAAVIDHEGIVDVYDAGFDDGCGFFIVMELLDGEDLRSRFRRSTSIREELLELVLRTLEPLEKAHAMHVVHRDLKPENIFVHKMKSGREIIKILDFGLAKAQREAVSTATGLSFGTPLYMSPEQITDAKGVTAAADVWSIGVMLYEILTRRYPFSADTVYKLIQDIPVKPHVAVRQLSPDVSPALSGLVDRCLSKAPHDRYATAGELAAALKAAMPARKAKVTRKYDVFLTCAPEEADWVHKHLHEPLCELLGPDNKRLTVFFQRGGADTDLLRLFDALASSGKVIPVYSSLYFEQPGATFTLIKAIELDPDGRLGKLVPLLIDDDGAAKIPGVASHILPERAQGDAWFERLAERLGARVPRKSQLALEREPVDLAVHTTLEPLEVKLGGATDRTVTIAASAGELSGTLEVAAKGGLARFTDLSFAEPIERTTLIAKAIGALSVESAPFAVKAVKALSTPDALGATCAIAKVGEVWFLGDRLVAVEDATVTLINTRTGERMVEIALTTRPRLVALKGNRVAVADWRGAIVVVNADGRHASCGPPARLGPTIPGAVCLGPDAAFVGYWNGDVVRVADDGAVTLVVRHAVGVQALQVDAGRVYVADIAGKLAIYRDGAIERLIDLEAPIRLLRAFGDIVIAASESTLFHVPPRGEVVKDRLFLKSIAGALADSAHPVAVDHDGRGVRLDRGLGVVGRFQAPARGRPVAADDAGQWCALRYDDGAKVLVKGDRVVYRQKSGPLSVSADGARLAIGTDAGLRVIDSRQLGELEGTIDDAG